MLLTRLGSFVVRHRHWFMLAGLLVMGFGIFAAAQLRLHDDPNQWPPASHPEVQLNNRIQEHFGGANLVSITVTAKDGDIFNIETLAKIKRITERLPLIHGVIPYTITSMSSLNTKTMRFIAGENGEEDMMEILPLMNPNSAPKTAEQVARIKQGAFNKNTLAEGFLVSTDGKSARILADFRTAPFKDLPYTDPVAIYQAVQGIIQAEDDAGHVIRATGTPVIIGWVNSEGLYYVKLAFGFFLLAVSVTLWVSFRNATGVIFPVAAGLFGTIMGFACYRIFFGEVLGSASALIAPFIIVAVGAFHAVQFLKRFYEQELPQFRDPQIAAVKAFSARFAPMFISLVADAVAFLVLALVPFENVRVLGLVTLFGMLCVTLAEFFLILPALGYMSQRGVERALQRNATGVQHEGFLERGVRAVIAPLVHQRRAQLTVAAVTAVLIAISLWSLRGLSASQDNTYAIHNYLTQSWEGNSIYEMEMDIRQRFGGVYPMTILIEAQGETAKGYLPLQAPHIMQKMEALAAFLDEDPAVYGVTGLPVFLKAMNRFMTGDLDENFTIPTDPSAIGTYFFFYTSGQPGGFDAYVDPPFRSSVLTAVVEDTRRETVERLMQKTRAYVESSFNDATVKAHVAGGSIGIASAFNESIGKWLVIGSILSALLTYLVASIMLRSLSITLIMLLPLVAGTIFWLALMRLAGIELNSNAVTSLAIASGIGIDAGVYCLYRFREEIAKGGSTWEQALISSFVYIFRPLAASNAALILGCWALVPIPLYLGYVGFGMGLILLLTSLMSFVLLPLLWSVIRPRGLAGDTSAARRQSEAALAA